MESMKKGLIVPTCVLKVWPKIPQMHQNLSANFVCPSPIFLDCNEKMLHWVPQSVYDFFVAIVLHRNYDFLYEISTETESCPWQKQVSCSIALQEWRKVQIFGGAVIIEGITLKKGFQYFLLLRPKFGGPNKLTPHRPLVFQVPPALYY